MQFDEKIRLVSDQASGLLNQDHSAINQIETILRTTDAAIPDSGSDWKDDASHFRRQMMIDVMVNGVHDHLQGDVKREYPATNRNRQMHHDGKRKGKGERGWCHSNVVLLFTVYRSPLK